MSENRQKCVYCNSEDLSLSDIIPYALTGAKIAKKIVCKKHNKYTNEKFESIAIERFDCFRNELGFKTRDGNPISYYGNIVIDNMIINHVKLFDRKSFYSKQIFDTIHNGSKFKVGNIDKLKLNPSANPTPLNMKDVIMQYDFSLRDLFISQEMKRTVAKISYEWHCYNNKICGYEERYSKIVEYITNDVQKVDDDIVENVIDAYAYFVANKLCEFGTNSIYEYTDNIGCCYVIFNFWNVIIYKVKIFSDGIPNISNNRNIELSRYNLDNTKDKINFGVMSDNYNVLSENPEDALKRLYNLYINNLTALTTNIVLTIYTARKMVNDMIKDLSLFKNGEIDIANFINFEEPRRIFIIKLILQFSEEESNYNFGENFNKNILKIFNSDEFLRINQDDRIQIIKNIIEMDDKDILIGILEKGISVFDKIYENEITNLN